MLSIGKMGAGQHRYYLGEVAEGAEDYYSGEGEAAGYWLGDAAEELGLEGHVEPDQLVAMLTGMDPASGEPLGLRQVAGGAIPGFDLTFSAPKSVSLAWAMGGDDAGAAIAAAHAEAVQTALNYMQRSACLTRRGANHEFVAGNGFIAAAYVHRTSRAKDPQLHTHVLIANATKGPDGKWRRLYHPAIYQHAKTAGYLYEAKLRAELTRRLGVEWEETRNGIAEIKGFDLADLRHYSQRRAEILEAAGPQASRQALRVATLATREAKDKEISESSLREHWLARAAEIGLTQEKIRSTFGRARPTEQVLTVEQIGREATAHASHFDRRDAIQAVAGLLTNGAPAEKVEALADSFLAHEQVIAIGATAKGERFTTRRIWELEQTALASAGAMADEGGRAQVHEIVIARTLAARPSMKPDQEQMVRRLLGGGEGIAVVIGEAGSGKTYATTAAAEGWAASGIEVRAAAPTWRAANVLRNEGLDATSVAKLLAECDGEGSAGLRPGSVLVVDEAGMVGSAELTRLIDHAQRARAKLVLIGDPEQLGEIEAGGLFASIAQRQEVIHLDEVIRHSHELDREGARRIRLGEGPEAFAAYEQEGRVVVAADAAARREAMVADWWRSYGAGEDALMIAKTNSEAQRLNALAREVAKADGRLGAVDIEVAGQHFAAGDQVITRINDHRNEIYNRERWRVTEVRAESGALVLDGIDTARRVCVDSVFLGRLRERDGGPAIEHAYAATTYQAQGATVDRAYVAVDPSMDRQEFYVAASRSREETFFYATPEVSIRADYAPAERNAREGIEHIAEAAKRDGAQVSAHDQALLAKYKDLPASDLYRARDALRSEAMAEGQAERAREQVEKELARSEEWLTEKLPAQAEQAQGLSRRQRKEELERIEQMAARYEARRAEQEAGRATLGPQSHEARAEVAAVEHLVAERERAAVTAARVSPPEYIVRELGPRPSDPVKARTWDRAVSGIEGYRLRHGIRDRSSALGKDPTGAAERQDWHAAQRRVRDSQLRLSREAARSVERGGGIEIGI